jgi:PKD repeat protein
MKKLILTALTVITTTCLSVAQKSEGAQLHPCGTYEAMEEAFKADPNLKVKYNLIQSQLDLEYQAALKEKENTNKKMTAATVYTIPVVFHVMGPQNISDQVFINCINQINKDYSRKGSDTGTINTNFRPIYVDAEIQFALAKRDPNGKCTNGIIRHDNQSVFWSQSSPNYAYSGTGTNRWPREKYLNVYIVDCISSSQISCPTTSGLFLGGYTYLPGSSPGASADAIVMLGRLLGQNQITDARTLSHEIGHWINLQHTFGSTNSPGQTCGDDGVTDTPVTRGVQSQCPSSEVNTCSGSGNLWNVENIMDYSSCPKMFTSGQSTRMRSALASSTAGRSTLWSPANMIATGLSGSYTCAPVADLKANKTTLCQNTTVNYTNLSQVGSSGSISWVFEGGSPASSTATAPTVTYANPGTYSVSITATNPEGTNTMTKTSYIKVVNGGGGYTAPTTQDFEGANLPNDYTILNNNNNAVQWQLNNSAGGNSTSQSIFLNNASATSTGGHIDMFETPFYNLSNTTNSSLSYYYSYAKKAAAQKDSFRVQYSLDCGGTWTNILGIPSLNTMATNTGGTLTAAFVPTSTQWFLTTIQPTLLSVINNKPSVKFRFFFKSDISTGSSNNFYIDQINLSGTVGINELEIAIGLNLYPNPTNGSSQLEFNLQPNQKASIRVFDMIGRVIETASVEGNNVIYTINKNGQLSSGVYMVSLEVNNQSITKKLIIE